MAQDVDEFEFFLDKPWSDGLPVVTPTEARVQRMLEGTHCAPDEVVGHIPPMLEPATVRIVAIHALMAGCKPDYLPVVLGGLRPVWLCGARNTIPNPPRRPSLRR
jgi:hypothetical protein